MLTTIAKGLVLINTAMSLIFLAWATSVYVNRIEYNTRDVAEGETTKKLEGKVDEVRNRLAELVFTRQKLTDLWLKTYSELIRLEPIRFENEKWYQDEMRIVKTGKLTPDGKYFLLQALAEQIDPSEKVVAALKVDPNGRIVSKHERRQAVYRYGNTEIRTRAEYIDKSGDPSSSLSAVSAEIAEMQENKNKAIARVAAAEEQINALKVRIKQYQDFNRLLEQEIEFLTPQLVNSEVESQIILLRKSLLERRLAELQQGK
jgi:hypothetical protein